MERVSSTQLRMADTQSLLASISCVHLPAPSPLACRGRVNSTLVTLQPLRNRVLSVLEARRDGHVLRVAADTSDRQTTARQEDQQPQTLRQEGEQSNQEVADRLIPVFRSRTRQEWRKLIAFSKQWRFLADTVFNRLKQKIQVETDPTEALALQKLLRGLLSVHEEVQRYDELLARFEATHPSEWEPLVAASRPQLTTSFFAHLDALVQAAAEDRARQEELITLGTRLAGLVELHDKVAEDEAALAAAAESFDGLLQVGSLEEADRMIDELAGEGRLDPALLLTMAKAYNSTKDTDMTRTEVKDIMAHLYFKAKETFARQSPPEVRILKHLLTLESTAERAEALSSAFTPGPDIQTEETDYLHTTPDVLTKTISAVLSAYDLQKAGSGMLADTASLMNPEVIQRLREIEQQIRKEYL